MRRCTEATLYQIVEREPPIQNEEAIPVTGPSTPKRLVPF